MTNDAMQAERREDATPVLLAVGEVARADGSLCRLFVGNLVAAGDPAALYEAGITASLNVSLNIFAPELELPDGSSVRRAKVGLIDGAGNTAAHMAAAVLALEGLVSQASPGKPHYPPHRAGHVLVHCRGGRSRSVAVLALYLHLKQPGIHPDLDETIAEIRRLRGNSQTYPLPDMVALAKELARGGGLATLLRG